MRQRKQLSLVKTYFPKIDEKELEALEKRAERYQNTRFWAVCGFILSIVSLILAVMGVLHNLL